MWVAVEAPLNGPLESTSPPASQGQPPKCVTLEVVLEVVLGVALEVVLEFILEIVLEVILKVLLGSF